MKSKILLSIMFIFISIYTQAQNPYIVKDINTSGGTNSSSPLNLTNVNGVLYFAGTDASNGLELWKSDGTDAGTVLVKDIYAGSTGSNITSLVNVNGVLFFVATNSTNGAELWKSDGTGAGTVMVKDIFTGTSSSNPTNLINVNGVLYFSANNGTTGSELWKSDGTDAGTVMVKDIFNGSNSSSIGSLAILNGKLFFRATDGVNGSELWTTDGTSAGTTMVANINTGANLGSAIINLTAVNGLLYFSANNGISGTELWRSDGTTTGTVIARDINSGSSSSSPNSLINANGTLYFNANDGVTGIELWKADNINGVVRVKDINNGLADSSPTFLTNINGVVYFTANTVDSGYELWRTDNVNGAVMVKDIKLGSTSSNPTNLTNINGTLYFQADDGIHGIELWRNDVTNGAVLVKDLNEGTANSNPQSFIDVTDGTTHKLYFVADGAFNNTSYGVELWSVGNCTTANPTLPNATNTQNSSQEKQTNPTTKTCHCDIFNNLIDAVDATGNSPISGVITSRQWIESSQPAKFAIRHYEISPANNAATATGKVTLYFTQADFDTYNAVNLVDLPTNPTDVAGKTNVLIEKRNGVSNNQSGLPETYTGNPTVINPVDADIVWNPSANRWEISFDVSGFGGLFLITPKVALPTEVSSNKTAICIGQDVQLSANCVAGTVTWYSQQADGTALGTGTSFSQSPNANITYYAACNDGTTESNRVSTGLITVNALPTSSASSNSAICAGTTLNLSSSGGVSYAWIGANSFTSTLQNPSIISATTAASGTYQVTVTNANGCTAIATTSVIVNALPTATASSNSQICAGNTLNLMASGGVSYAWTGLGTSFSSTLQNPSILSATTSASGVYQVTVKNENGCTASAVTLAFINPLPIATASSNSPICAGTTLNLSSSNGGTSYAWTGANSFSSTLQNPSITSAMPLASGTYRVLVTNFFGCTATATTSVIVNALPTATASNNSPICAGTTLNLLGGVQGNNQSLVSTETYSWTGVNSFSSTLQNPSISSATTLASGTYKVTVTDVNGCTASATTSVMVNALPTATASSNSPICAGTSLNLLGGVQGNNQSLVSTETYSWTGVNSFSSTLQNPSILSATTLASGTYQVTVTNSNGCTATATTSVIVNALPTATASSNSPICAGTSLNLLGGVQGNNQSLVSNETYSWTGINSFSSTLQNPSISSATTLASGTYQVTVTNSNGCTATAITSAIVNPTPVTPTTQADAQIIFGGGISLTAIGCEGTIKWYQKLDDALVVMPVSPTVTTQYYAKCEITSNGITCTSEKSNDVTVTVLKPSPPVTTGATICIGTGVTLTATGCSGEVGVFTLKWYQKADSILVSMPVSPTVSTDYFAKCEQTFNGVTAISSKSNFVTLVVLNPSIPAVSGATIYKGNSTSLVATGCAGEGFTVKWYETTTNNLVMMPVSPSITSKYYAKCEHIANNVTCISNKSDDVTITVVNRIFVDITKASLPSQNGTSWAMAYGDLQQGLAQATQGIQNELTEVWVAKGTYNPTATTNRNLSFVIPSGVKIYGGFLGMEDELNARNFRTNPTILSGEIGSQQAQNDNSYHVVVFDGSNVNTLLDGFTITGGFANFDAGKAINLPIVAPQSTLPIESGAGIILQNQAIPTIINCIIVNNAATVGGGIYGNLSSPQIINCKFMGNQATFGSAIYLENESNAEIKNTLIAGNKGAGALYNNYSNPILVNCTFGGNGGYNGGIFNSNSQPTVTNSILWGNTTPLNDTQSIITYSVVQGGYAGVGNLNYDPQFVSQTPEGLSPNTTGDYRLKPSSLAIDRGNNGSISLTDLDLDENFRRFNGGRVDMGAFEFQGNSTSSVVISVSSGDWEINSTWDAGRVPKIGDLVIIDNNHVVNLNSVGSAKNIEYFGTGTLKFKSANGKLNLGF